MNKVLKNEFEASLSEESIEETQRQKNILELLLTQEDANYFINSLRNNYCEIITADGGFDYSIDYNSQEDMSYKLLYCEIFIALNIQKKKDHL